MVDRAHALPMLDLAAHGSPYHMRTCVRALEQPDDRGGRGHAAPATAIRPPCAASTRRRRSTSASTRSTRSPRSTACRRPRRCRSLDDQPVPRLHPCVRLLPRGRDADPHGGRPPQAAPQLRVGDEIYGTERAGSVPALCAHDGARPLGEREAGVSRDARGRHRAARQRRPPVPHRARLEVRDGAAQRPVSGPTSRLGTRCLAPGGSWPGRQQSGDYERGYLCGIVRGDGNLASYSYDRPDGRRPAWCTVSGSRCATRRRSTAPTATCSRTGCTRRGLPFTPVRTERRPARRSERRRVISGSA